MTKKVDKFIPQVPTKKIRTKILFIINLNLNQKKIIIISYKNKNIKLFYGKCKNPQKISWF